MAKFMVPKFVSILEEMPRTPTGKPEKGKLKQLALDQLQRRSQEAKPNWLNADRPTLPSCFIDNPLRQRRVFRDYIHRQIVNLEAAP